MKYLSSLLVLMTLGVAAQAAERDQSTLLPAGRYEVTSRLELPYVESNGVTRHSFVCVTAGECEDTQGLGVLSENNPLAKCPPSNARREGTALYFDIVCPGGNAAVGSAKYLLKSDSFEGRIKMKMGGKNMTMTETQSGVRVGNCPSATAPHS